jgi:hypothetical protein
MTVRASMSKIVLAEIRAMCSSNSASFNLSPPQALGAAKAVPGVFCQTSKRQSDNTPNRETGVDVLMFALLPLVDAPKPH